jgi:hypothetical protein
MAFEFITNCATVKMFAQGFPNDGACRDSPASEVPISHIVVLFCGRNHWQDDG